MITDNGIKASGMGAIVATLASNTSIEVLDVSGLVLDVCKYHDGSMHGCMRCG